MVYKYGEYILYCSEVKLKVGQQLGKIRKNYFFSRRIPKQGVPCDLPIGYEIGINIRSRMPYLKYNKDRKATWKR